MVVNNQEQVETIIDPGSQVITMANSVCHELGLIYDPTIQLNNILMGRPFNVLTESIVKNYANEDQTITIHNPNTGQQVTIPTIPRGSAR
jgi:hypothetical protein